MLYLEDYLEMIEHLPQELKDRFTEIRELDLEVQNGADKLDECVKSFFQLARKQKTPERDAEFEAIRKDYYKVLDNADEKVNQANQLYELVDRYLRKLDQELHKFKMELEADNAGITEILEKRSIEMDMQDRERERSDFHSQKENRYVAGQVAIKSEKKAERKNSHERAGTSGVPSAHSSGMTTPTLAYSLGHMGAGGNAIAAAASQAIAATQQMQQGRRTASLKASYDAVHLGLQSAEFSVGNREILVNTDLHQAAQQALAATTSDRSGSDQKRNKRKSQHTHNPDFVQPPAEELSEEPVLMDTTEPTEWSSYADPAEPRYCLCNEISYGDMVACDNQDCPIEWFHYGCVGITQTPKGKWYCPQCAASMKRRGRR